MDGTDNRDRLRQLRAFSEVARLGTMSKAADRLSLTQPAVSRQVRSLEQDLSTRLFERRGPKISLTSSGEILQQLVLPLLEGVDRLAENFHNQVQGSLAGQVRISAGLGAAVYILPDYVKRFHASHPEVQVHIEINDGRENLEVIRHHAVDFGVGGMEVVPEDLEFRKLMSSAQVLITPLDHPLADNDIVTVEDLKSCRWILPLDGTHSRLVADAIARYFDTELSVSVATAGWSVIKRYVEAGLGIAMVPNLCLTARDRVSTVEIDKRLEAYVRPRVYGLILRRDALLPVAATRFIQMLDPTFPD